MLRIVSVGERLVHRLVCVVAAIPSLFCLMGGARAEQPPRDPTQNEALRIPPGQSKPWTEDQMRNAAPLPTPVDRVLVRDKPRPRDIQSRGN
jgi:hypothetical protein